MILGNTQNAQRCAGFFSAHFQVSDTKALMSQIKCADRNYSYLSRKCIQHNELNAQIRIIPISVVNYCAISSYKCAENTPPKGGVRIAALCCAQRNAQPPSSVGVKEEQDDEKAIG